MPTIIDSLVISLGFDTDPFRRGVKKAQDDQRKFRDVTKKNTSDIGETITSLAKQAGALFLGFEGAKGALSYFAGLTVATANLGRFSQNVGVSAHEVNAWGQAVELAGGSASDAQADLQGLSASLTNLKATGDVSPMLLLFQRLGVAIYDAQGNTRKLTDIYKDLGDKLKQYNRADAFNLAKQGGLSDSTINLIMTEGTERQHLLDLAEENNRVTEESVQKAQALQQAWRGIGQEVKGAATDMLTKFAPGTEEAHAGVKLMESALLIVRNAVYAIGNGIGAAAAALSALSHGNFSDAKNIVKDWFNTAAEGANKQGAELNDVWEDKAATPTKKPAASSAGDIQGSITDTAKKYGIPENVLRNLIKTESHFDPNAYNKSSGATGIAQLLPKYHPNAGKSATGDIDEAGKTLLEYYRQYGSWELAAAAYNTGPANLKKELAGAKAIPKETNDYVHKIFGANDNALSAARFAAQQSTPGAPATQQPSAGASSSSTTVQIDQVNVHGVDTNNADAVAAALPDAMKRKGVVNQADTGMS